MTIVRIILILVVVGLAITGTVLGIEISKNITTANKNITALQSQLSSDESKIFSLTGQLTDANAQVSD